MLIAKVNVREKYKRNDRQVMFSCICADHPVRFTPKMHSEKKGE
jgi:hypothetical protein